MRQKAVARVDAPDAGRGRLQVGRPPLPVQHDEVAGRGAVQAADRGDRVVHRLMGQGQAGEEVAREARAPAVAGEEVGADAHAAVVDAEIRHLPGREQHQDGRHVVEDHLRHHADLAIEGREVGVLPDHADAVRGRLWLHGERGALVAGLRRQPALGDDGDLGAKLEQPGLGEGDAAALGHAGDLVVKERRVALHPRPVPEGAGERLVRGDVELLTKACEGKIAMTMDEIAASLAILAADLAMGAGKTMEGEGVGHGASQGERGESVPGRVARTGDSRKPHFGHADGARRSAIRMRAWRSRRNRW